MKLLGIDTTGNTLSAAVSEDGRLLSEIYLDAGKKHSRTLMLAVDGALRAAGYRPDDMDALAVASGPGSFTGIRIGTAACAAMAHGAGKPVVAVNTLDALIENAGAEKRTVCAVMDARRGEVYTMAKCGGETVVRECAVPLVTLLKAGPAVFAGDAAERFQNRILEHRPDSLFLPQQFILQRASSVCAVAERMYCRGEFLRYDELEPHYLRESQAERLKKR
ncbi:MAG: hypothetical protein DELT_03320 [Desulfovibrio sp.]